MQISFKEAWGTAEGPSWSSAVFGALLQEVSQLPAQSKGAPLTLLPQGITAELLTAALLETGITDKKPDFMCMTWLL